jgi:hypothetical protein
MLLVNVTDSGYLMHSLMDEMMETRYEAEKDATV